MGIGNLLTKEEEVDLHSQTFLDLDELIDHFEDVLELSTTDVDDLDSPLIAYEHEEDDVWYVLFVSPYLYCILSLPLALSPATSQSLG